MGFYSIHFRYTDWSVVTNLKLAKRAWQEVTRLGRLPAKLCEQRRQRLDELLMSRAIARNQAIAVLHLEHIVTKRVTKQVGHLSSCFSEYQLWRTSVPLLCSWREMNVQIALTLDNETAFYPNRSASHLFFNTKNTHNFIH